MAKGLVTSDGIDRQKMATTVYERETGEVQGESIL